MEQQNQQPIQEKTEPKPPIKISWKFIAIVVVVAVLVGGGVLWYVRLFDQQISQLETPNVTLKIPKEKKSEVDTSDFTLSGVEGWQTYRNDEFGFEVSYPNNWSFNEDFSFEKGFFISNQELGSISILPRGEFDHGLPFEATKTSSKFLSEKSVVIREWQLEHEQKILRIYNFTDNLPEWITCESDLKNCNRIEITIENIESINTFDQILSTFRFIE